MSKKITRILLLLVAIVIIALLTINGSKQQLLRFANRENLVEFKDFLTLFDSLNFSESQKINGNAFFIKTDSICYFLSMKPKGSFIAYHELPRFESCEGYLLKIKQDSVELYRPHIDKITIHKEFNDGTLVHLRPDNCILALGKIKLDLIGSSELMSPLFKQSWVTGLEQRTQWTPVYNELIDTIRDGHLSIFKHPITRRGKLADKVLYTIYTQYVDSSYINYLDSFFMKNLIKYHSQDLSFNNSEIDSFFYKKNAYNNLIQEYYNYKVDSLYTNPNLEDLLSSYNDIKSRFADSIYLSFEAKVEHYHLYKKQKVNAGFILSK